MNKEEHKQIALRSIFLTFAIFLIISSFIELFRGFGSFEGFIPRWFLIVLPSCLLVIFSSSIIIVLYYYFRLLLKSMVNSIILLCFWIIMLVISWKFKLIEYGLITITPLIIYEMLYIRNLKTTKINP